MRRSSTKKIIITLCILLILSLGAIGVLYILIQRSSYKVSNYEIQQQKINEKIVQDKSLQSFLETSGPDIERLSSRIVPKEGTVEFIELIEKLGRDNNLSIEVESVKINEAPTQKEQVELLTLSLATKGSWNSTYRFLSLLETLPYKVIITSVGMTEQGSEGDPKAKSVQSGWNGAFTFGVIKYKE